MDFIEDRWKRFWDEQKKITLKKSMMIYVGLGLLAAFGCCLFAVQFLENWKEMIKNLEESVRANRLLVYLSFAEVAVIAFFVCVIIFLVCHLFYKNRMEPALALIEKEICFLNREDLSFDCSVDGEDEMAQVCKSLNDMRLALIENRRNTWALVEEQRVLHAVFAHDIRTPLTVMKGYLQMMEKFYPTGNMPEEKVMETMKTLSGQVERIEQFSATMKRMNRMEEWEIACRKTATAELLELLKKNAEGLAQGQKARIEVIAGEMRAQEIFCDGNIVAEVADNLMLNALRYARETIRVTLEVSDDRLFCYVKDDGPGFSEEALEMGARPYFTTENGHMGLGLSICRLLCKKHGGDLELTNSIHQGGIACAFFRVSAR